MKVWWEQNKNQQDEYFFDGSMDHLKPPVWDDTAPRIPVDVEDFKRHDPARIAAAAAAAAAPPKPMPTQIPKENTVTDFLPAYIVATLVALGLLFAVVKRAQR